MYLTDRVITYDRYHDEQVQPDPAKLKQPA